MVASRIAVFALLWPAVGAVLRHAAHHAAGSIVNKATDAKTDEAEVHRVAGLLDVEKDLETDRRKDAANLRELEAQIVSLVHKRDAGKRDEARKDREIAFLQAQIGQKAHTEASAVVTQESQQESKAQADMTVDSAMASADQVVKQAAAVESSAQSEQKVDSSAQAVAAQAASTQVASTEAASAQAASAQAAAAAAAAEAAAQKRAQEEAAASAAAAATAAAAAAEAGKKRKAEAEESREVFEARIRQEAEERARIKIQAEQEAEARLRGEAEAKMRAKLEAEQAEKAKAAEAARAGERAKVEAENKQQQDEQKKKDDLADSADDSFKQFMKEEDGEDQMGDADYEDSANALAGAIGWNRQEIEHKADSAVKQLTEAIGGKKVVKSLQGMMAGVR